MTANVCNRINKEIGFYRMRAGARRKLRVYCLQAMFKEMALQI